MNDGSPKDTSPFGSTGSTNSPGSHHDDDPYLGATLKGRYRIERLLGRGGLGAVYLAVDLQLHNKQVVVKVMRDNPTVGAEWVLKKFREEIKALARIDHPGVVGSLDAGEMPDGKPYIVMQYVEGESLRTVMRTGALTHERIARFVRQICQALAAAHEKGVVHRDLKPENIMIQTIGPDEEYARLIDFGIATVRDSDTGELPGAITTVAGTVLYMAPEQLQGKPKPASDIYAMGIVAYELLTGTVPFHPASPYQLLDLQRNHSFRRPTEISPSIPPAAEAAILKALSFAPIDRYSSARAFGDDIAKALTADSAVTTHAGGESASTAPSDEAATVNVLKGSGGETRRAGSNATNPVTAFGGESAVTAGVGSTNRTDVVAAAVSVPVEAPKAPTKIVPTILAGVVVLAVAAGLFWYIAKFVGPTPGPGPTNVPATNNGGPGTVTPTPTRELAYAIEVQKVRDGRDYEAPFTLSGEILFERDYKIRIQVTAREQGYLYILNEGENGPDGLPTFNLLFPSPTSNGGTASVSPNALIQIPARSWIVFDNAVGTEKVWLVWSVAAVPELEAVKYVANPQDRGAILKPEQLAAVRAFITAQAANKASVERIDNNPTDRRTVLRADGDVLVHVVPLAHN
ncbi:MAG: protein kinase [Blastocatellia bacterium]|nr:protein kinase [Blastocatellia bacterium]